MLIPSHRDRSGSQSITHPAASPHLKSLPERCKQVRFMHRYCSVITVSNYFVNRTRNFTFIDVTSDQVFHTYSHFFIHNYQITAQYVNFLNLHNNLPFCTHLREFGNFEMCLYNKELCLFCGILQINRECRRVYICVQVSYDYSMETTIIQSK